MFDPFEAWMEASLAFFRQRRLDPFSSEQDDLEAQVREEIKEKEKVLREVAEGMPIHAFETVRDAVGMHSLHRPISELVADIEKQGISPEQKEYLLSVVGDSEWTFMGNGIRFMRALQHDVGELLRHYDHLDEQRRGMAIHREGAALSFDSLPHAVWVEAWLVAGNKEHIPPSPKQWLNWYTTAAKSLTSLGKDQRPSDYLWELASLCYELGHSDIEKFLGGVLYSTLLHREHAEARAKEIYPKIDYHIPTLFQPGMTIQMRSGKAAMRARIDTHPYFVFKIVSDEEAANLRAVYDVIQNPQSSHWRVASFQFGTTEPTENDLGKLVKAVKADKDLEDHFTLPCVRTSGIVFPFFQDVLIAMEYAGENLADEIGRAQTAAEKEALYERGLDQLRRFHLLVTENTIAVDGEPRISPNIATYADQPRLPHINYRDFLRKKIFGTDNPDPLKRNRRLPENKLFPLVLQEAEPIFAYLDRRFLGVMVLDTDETNFAKDGLIDISPHWGNTCWDLARFLYDGSFLLKQDVDRTKLRDNYISRTIDKMMQMSQWHTGTKEWSFVEKELLKMYDSFPSREEFIRQLEPLLQGVTLCGMNVFVAHTICQSVMDWDYCRSDSREVMRKTIQAAAILVTMGEVGSLWNYSHTLEEEGKEHQFICSLLDTEHDSHKMSEEQERVGRELEHAVRDSCALMSQQGFGSLRVYWESYLQDTGVIPPQCFGESSLPSLCMIPTLYDDVHHATGRTSHDCEGEEHSLQLGYLLSGLTQALDLLQRASERESAR